MRNTLAAAALATILTGCAMASMDSAGGMGATQGGVQDMQLARKLIQDGYVPDPEALLVEGMFSEHDLPLSGPACTTTLCLRSGLGWAATVDGAASGWAQIGMSSTVDPEHFQRDSITLVAVVDVSGSMGWEYQDGNGEYPSAGALSRRLLKSLAAQLNQGDRFALVAYGDHAWVQLGMTAGSDQGAIQGAIDALSTDGSTNLEAGLALGYQVAREAAWDTAAKRVMLFSDVQPNVGSTDSGSFQQIIGGGVQERVGFTLFGMGVGLESSFLATLANTRGANAFTLARFSDADKLMADDWPWFVSPIAYDLTVSLQPGDGFQVAAAYGFPGTPEGTTGFLKVSTVFLSKKRGALLLRLAPNAQGSLQSLSLTGRLAYTTLEGDHVEQDLAEDCVGQALDARGQFFAQRSVARTTALAQLVSSMRRAAEAYRSDHAAAVEIMRPAATRFAQDAADLGDADLTVEVELGNRLLELMQQDAPQGDRYGMTG